MGCGAGCVSAILRSCLEPGASHHLIPILVQSEHVQESFPILFWYSCMSCSGAFPPSLLPSMPWLRSLARGDRRSSSPAMICSWFLTRVVWDTLERGGAEWEWAEPTASLRRGVPSVQAGPSPTCTDIFYRHGCICVDNMVF